MVVPMKKTVALTENYMFRRLYNRGKCQVQPHVAVYAAKNRSPGNRLGITASKKLGNAVQRNRARRLIAEAYRLIEDELPSGLDIVVVARNRAVGAKMQAVRTSLQKAFNVRASNPAKNDLTGQKRE
jgi:ribonuclease P protein component